MFRHIVQLFKREKPYTRELRAAIERTERLGYGTGPFSLSRERFLTSGGIQRVAAAIDPILRPLSPQHLDHRCIPVTASVQSAVDDALSTKSVFTLGYLQKGEHTLFQFSEADLQKWLRVGVDVSQVRVHAWLTLPSTEIIDVTLLTSIALKSGNHNQIGSIIMRHPSEIVGGWTFHPMAVGVDILAAIVDA